MEFLLAIKLLLGLKFYFRPLGIAVRFRLVFFVLNVREGITQVGHEGQVYQGILKILSKSKSK
jgi:hypothetical protein